MEVFTVTQEHVNAIIEAVNVYDSVGCLGDNDIEVGYEPAIEMGYVPVPLLERELSTNPLFEGVGLEFVWKVLNAMNRDSELALRCPKEMLEHGCYMHCVKLI
ncbi:UNVERIFIED_ORG: hypothetical protein GCAPEGMB_00473 [Vibrio phage V07]